MLRVCLIGLFAATVSFASGCSGCSKTQRISAGGATFINPIMQKWAGEYRKAKNVEIDYVSKGSGYGVEQMTAKTIDFGCSDAPLTKEQFEAAQAKGGDVIHIPLTMGAIAVVYNVPELSGKELRLTGDVLAAIYLKQLTKWNDQRIASLNPGLPLPEKDIVVVARAEKSGTTNIFSEYLSKASQGKLKASTKPDWPQGVLGQEGNDGVAGYVKGNPYSIGYVELLFAKKNELPMVKLKNKAGQWIGPDPDAVTAAAAEAMKSKPTQEPYSLYDLTYSLTDADGPASYPICGISYAVLFAKQPKDKGPVIVEFLKWATTDGQAFAKDMDYAPLPEELRKAIQDKLGQVKFE